MLDTLGSFVPRAPETPPNPASLVAILMTGRLGPTWDRYVPALRDWQRFAAANGITAIPAKPAEFLRFLAMRAEGDAGSAADEVAHLRHRRGEPASGSSLSVG